MKIIDIEENGLFLQFLINEDNRLSLYNFSTKKICTPEDFCDKVGAFAAVEVQLAGAEFQANKHFMHRCPSKPRYVCHEDTRNEKGRLLIFTLNTECLEIKQYYQFYDNIKTVSCFAEVKNISEEKVGLEYVASFCYGGLGSKDSAQPLELLELYIPHNSWCAELNWRKESLLQAGFNSKKLHASTKRIRYSNRGCWSTKEYLPMGILNDKSSGEYYFWQIEASGSWEWELGDISQRIYLRLSGPNEQGHSWYKELESGEVFSSVSVALSVTDGDFGEAVGEMTKYRRKIIDKGRIDCSLPVIFNDYMDCLWADPNTEDELRMVEKAAELGAEIYCMDAGWYSMGDWWPLVGEWEICEERFEGGIKQIFDKIAKKGMRAGIWLEPEVMGVDCPLVPQFEDCFFKYRGKNIISKGRYQLDFRKERVRNHLNRVIDSLIEKLGVSYFKFDYNIDPIYGTEVDADSCGDGLLQYNKAYLDWIDSIYERHPQVMIENCASGAMRMDYCSLKHFALQSVSDSTHYNEFAHMSVMSPTAVLSEQSGIWVVSSPKNSFYENAFAAVNAMLYRMYLSGRVDNIAAEDFESLKTAVRCYKEIRSDIVGSLPLYPNGICNAESDWMIGGALSGDRKTVYITAAHLKGEESERNILVKELDGKCCEAKILYPSGLGTIALRGSSLKVALPERAAVLIKINIL